jgi:hypothetical protein
MLVLSLRDYILPGSQRGPKPELKLSPRFIPLQRPTRWDTRSSAMRMDNLPVPCYFTRDCSGLEYLTDGNCFVLTEAKIPPGENVGFSVRDSTKPTTERGPDSSLILPSMLLELKRP